MNLRKVLFGCFVVLAFGFGGRWEETERINLPQGLVLRDFVRDYNGDIYLVGQGSAFRIDRRAKEVSNLAQASISFLIPTQRYGTILVHDDGVMNALGQDATQARLPSVSTANLMDGAVFEDSSRLYIALLYRNRLVIYRDGAELGSLALQGGSLALLPRANYLDLQVPFFTASDNQVSRWQGGTAARPGDYREQSWIRLRPLITGLAAGPSGQLFVSTPESVYTYDRQGNREDVIGNARHPDFGRIRTTPTPDTIYVYDRNANQIVVYVRKDRLNASAGPVFLEKNQPNPLESYTDIAFLLTEPLEIKLVVYNLIGGPVKVLTQGSYNKGRYEVRWDGKDDNGKPLPNGVYFYRLESKKGVKIRQLIVMR